MRAEPPESLVHVEAVRLREVSLGLFDDDATVEGALQLRLSNRRLLDQTLLQDADRGDVGEGAGGRSIGLVELADPVAEKVERPDDRLSQPHRYGMHGGKP